MAQNLKEANMDDVQNKPVQDDKFEIKYKSNTYDIKNFLAHHPGGINYVRPYKDKEIAQQLEQHEHSEAALYILEEYRKGGRKVENEDLERLVDYNKPMLGQLTKLGTKYFDWTISPVDREIILISPYLDWMTKTPWYMIPTIWIPCCIYFVMTGSKQYTEITKDLGLLVPIVTFFQGIALWSVLEYSLHRWVFHIQPSGRSKPMVYFHFLIHGLHHKVPFDSGRLVFPPIPASLIAYLVYKLITVLFSESKVFLAFAGCLAGYIAYDMTHYYIHHGSPSETSYFYNLKRFHNHHHFSQHNSGFGISLTFWDKIFNTVVKLKKLRMGIEW